MKGSGHTMRDVSLAESGNPFRTRATSSGLLEVVGELMRHLFGIVQGTTGRHVVDDVHDLFGIRYD